MTSYITKYIPDFPYKKQIFNGTSLALDWMERLNPEHTVSRIWGQFKDKKGILDDLAKPLKLNKKVVKLQDEYRVWNDWQLNKSLEVVRAGADVVKVAISSVKVINRYAFSFLPPLIKAALTSVAAGAGLSASAALVGINSYRLYEYSDVTVTGENALIQAASRFVTSVYGLIAAILMTVALFIHIPISSFLILALFTCMYLTEIFSDTWITF